MPVSKRRGGEGGCKNANYLTTPHFIIRRRRGVIIRIPIDTDKQRAGDPATRQL